MSDDRRHFYTLKLLQLALAFVLGLTVWSAGGRIEGALFPVVGGTVITEVEPIDGSWSRVWGGFEKLRDCQFVSIDAEWHQGQATVSVGVIFEEPATIRLPGLEAFGPWRIQANPDQFANVEATVYHRCHGLWLTETRFYP